MQQSGPILQHLECCNRGEFSFLIAYEILTGHLDLTFPTEFSHNKQITVILS